VVTHQLQVERRTAKGHRPKTDALPLDYATNHGVQIPVPLQGGVLLGYVWPIKRRCKA